MISPTTSPNSRGISLGVGDLLEHARRTSAGTSMLTFSVSSSGPALPRPLIARLLKPARPSSPRQPFAQLGDTDLCRHAVPLTGQRSAVSGQRSGPRGRGLVPLGALAGDKPPRCGRPAQSSVLSPPVLSPDPDWRRPHRRFGFARHGGRRCPRSDWPARPANVAQPATRHVPAERSVEGDISPGALIARLFLRPHQVFHVRVACQDTLEFVGREGIQLLQRTRWRRAARPLVWLRSRSTYTLPVQRTSRRTASNLGALLGVRSALLGLPGGTEDRLARARTTCLVEVVGRG